LCGNQLAATTPVLQTPRRAFSICLDCRAAGAQYPIPQPSHAAQSAPERPPRRIIDAGAPCWIQLTKPSRVLHRPDPYIPDRVMCGRVLPGRVPIHRTPPQPWPACPDCQQRVDAESRQDRRQRSRVPGPADQPRPPAVSAWIQRRLAAGPVLGDGPTGTAGTWRLPVGWVRLDGRSVWHRPHPERPDRVMCDLPLHPAVPVFRRRVGNKRACPDSEAVRAAALTELRDRERQRAYGESTGATTPAPPRLPRRGWSAADCPPSAETVDQERPHGPANGSPRRARPVGRTLSRTRSVSVRTVSGGMPTLVETAESLSGAQPRPGTRPPPAVRSSTIPAGAPSSAPTDRGRAGNLRIRRTRLGRYCEYMAQSDHEARDGTAQLLAAVGITVTEDGKARARARLAEAEDRWTPERWAALRTQLGLPARAT
jgi:hypothetical protein